MGVARRPKVVVLGGGFGGAETTFYLRWRLGDRADLTLVNPTDYLLFKPNTIYIPFGADPERFKVPLKGGLERKGINFIQASVHEIDPEHHQVRVDGKTLTYDYLVVATGAAMRPEEIPGLREHALTVWTPEEMSRLGRAYHKLVEKARAGERQRLLFLIPPNNRCSGPLYEIVLMTDTWLRRQRVRDKVEMTWTTFEKGYIQAFGPRLDQVVSEELARRGINGLKQHVVEAVEPSRVLYTNGTTIPYDLLVSFPPYIAKERFPSLPHDERGFIQVDLPTRRVEEREAVYAVGDTADFPVKQAFLALLQADAAAEDIAARILGSTPRFSFEPTSMCVMEEFDRATFAQVPLELTGDPAQPIRVKEDARGDYLVGVSPLWRLGKKMLGIYLPWRFASGEPFHAGLPWQTMEVGLKVMSRLLAS